MLNDCYYFGNYTPNGWASIIKKNCFSDYKKISICGYPNCVKQQIFKRIKLNFLRRNIGYTDLTTENGSMGVLCEQLKIIVVDGEFAEFDDSEKINIYDYVCEDFLKENNEKIKRFDTNRKRLEMRCERFLSACKSINDDMRRIDSINIDFYKLNRYSSRLWKKYGSKPTGKIGIQEKRFVTCVSQDGVELNTGAFDRLCKKSAVIYDKTGACSAPVIDKIKNYALSSGYNTISCICPVNLEIEHLIIPELKFGLFSSRYYHRAELNNCEKIYSSKFHTFNSPSTVQRLDFSAKAYKSLMNEVFNCIAGINEIDKNLNLLLNKNTDTVRIYNQIVNRIFP